MSDKILESINNRLGVIANLLLQKRLRNDETRTIRDQIEILNNLGLKPKEIADILRKTNTYINKEISSLRKAGKKKSGRMK